jgi:SPP1 gp7 family putative phage head morphogenesis protein
MDKGHKFTDKEIERLEDKLRRHYGKTNKAVTDMLTEHLNQYEDRIAEYQQRLDSGGMTEQQYEDAVYMLITTGNDWQQTQNAIVNEYVESDASAMQIIGATMLTVYLYNNLFKSKRMISRSRSHFDLDFKMPKVFRDKDNPFAIIIDLLNGKAFRRMLPPPNPNKMKDRLWHRVKLNSIIRQGIRKGKSVTDIAINIERLTKMDIVAAFRAARTGCTYAENSGKLDAMIAFRDKYGIDVKKMWYATLDGRTRTHHREIHGEVCELEEPFSNKLLFPADPKGDPSEVYNCRCTMLEVIDGVDLDIADAPSGKSREEWIEEKPKSKPYPIPKKYKEK